MYYAIQSTYFCVVLINLKNYTSLKKLIMKKILAIAISTIFGLGAKAQNNATITGKVTNNITNQVIIGTTVSLYKALDTSIFKIVVTDKLGKYSFDNVPFGKYGIAATNIDYQRNTIEAIEVSNTQILVKNIALINTNKLLDNVVVTSKKQYLERKLDKTVINVEAAITNAGSTALEVLEKSPGVSVDKDGNISLKGKQGVVVLIDGKQTYMGAQDLANYLQATPASNIDQIELMPNPSSKYDAAGNSGVINIKTKRNKQKGFNGTIKNTVATSKYLRTANTLNVNYKNGKFNVFSTFGQSQRRNLQVLSINRKYVNNENILIAIFDQTATFNKKKSNYNARFGVDFCATKKTTIGVVLTGYTNPSKDMGNNISFLKNSLGMVDSILVSTNSEKKNFNNTGANLNLRHVFDSTGKELTVDVDYLTYDSKQNQFFNSENLTAEMQKKYTELLKANLPTAIKIFSAKIDMTVPLKANAKIEFGLKTSMVNTNNVAGYFNIINNVSLIDNDKTNQFKYNENIHAAYINYSKTYKKWTLQSGLRLENTSYHGNQFGNPIKPDSTFAKSYTALFPTTFIGYTLNDKNDIGVSYGRRISRPDYESLNPFIFFIDKYTYEAGNPFLKPMFANVLEISHTYNKFLTTNFNYTHSKNLFNEYFEQLGYATIVKENNYGSVNDFSLSTNAEVKATKWLTVMPYVEVNHNIVNSQLNGFSLNTRGTSFNANINNQIKFSKKTNGEISGQYRSKMSRAQFNIGSQQQMSIAVSTQILKDKGSLKFYLNDVFNSGNNTGVINIQNTIASFTQKRDNRILGITFTYKFGKPLKILQRKTGGAGDEQNRIKS